jgi:hypothetical protein
MLKFIIIFIFALGAIFGIPQLRAKAMPLIDPLLTKLGPVGEKISAPSKKWAARNEANILIRKLAEEYNEKKELPDPLSFQPWIRMNTKGGKKGLDPWGRPYYLMRSGNQITVGSQGPDRRRNSADDVRVTVPIGS